MKKLTALFLALLLMLPFCTTFAAAADDESVAIVLVPEDETLLTAEYLALFFVDRDAVDEEIETSVSWYKETTKDGKTERELIEEMPLVIKITDVGPRIFAADGYKPSQELIDLVDKYAPEKDAGSEHEYRWHRIFNQDCRWRSLRYGTCKDCFGIEFDLARGNHSYVNGVCTVCGGEEPDGHKHKFFYDYNSEKHFIGCESCDYEESGPHEFGSIIVERDDEGHKLIYAECRICGYRNFHVPS